MSSSPGPSDRDAHVAASTCACGHAADWHSHDGAGDCEHDAECGCQKFGVASYSFDKHEWEPQCPHGDVCTGCDARGYCTRMEGPEAPSAATPSGRAYLSEDGLYRYSLTREILNPEISCLDEDERGDTVTFVGLNPSTADATQDDPTIRRCIRYAREWGFRWLKVVNLYALRATDPKQLWLADDPVGPENDHVLSIAFGGSDLTIAAWGVHAKPERVAEIMAWPIRPRICLGVTKDGHPRHPLYLRADAKPRPMPGEETEAWLLTA